jgi:hypothetical protein
VADDGEADGKTHDNPHQTYGRPGSRAPHIWLHRGGDKVSTIDLFGRSLVLLSGIEGAAWGGAARVAAGKFSGLELETHCIGTAMLRDPDMRFAESFGVTSTGAALVRPDGFVAWRAKAMQPDPERAMAAALGAVLQRA